ncbi:ABC transporter transmembrane domain-containing protein, partial [Oenococcus oeni]|uniref:ABC transporter transmembrane domain-containing protein n=1 Tax=Oenococcus oeni TaxID=1247 RepID=UPI000A72A5E8
VYTMLLLPDLTSNLINNGVIKGNINYIYHTGVWMALYSFISVLAGVANVYTSAIASQKLGMLLRRDIYNKVMSFSNKEFDQIGTSSLITRTTNDVVQIQNVAMMFLRMMLMSPIMLVAASIMAYSKSPQLTKIFLVSIPVLVIVTQQTVNIPDMVYSRLAELGIRQISIRQVGYDILNIDAIHKAGLRASNVAAYSPRAIAEYTLTQLLNLIRDNKRYYQATESGNWLWSAAPQG